MSASGLAVRLKTIDHLPSQIRCQHGSESFTAAMKEIEAMRRFRSPNIIRILDSAVVQEADHSSGFGTVPSSDGDGGAAGGVGKTVYLFLPYYPLGNLQDAINRHVVNGTRYSESEMLQLFLGTAKALQAMHHYRLPDVPVGGREEISSNSGSGSRSSRGQPSKRSQMKAEQDEAPLIDGMAANGEADPFGIESDPEEEDDENDGHNGGRGTAYPPKPNKGKGKSVTIEQPALGGEGTEAGRGGEMVPYAHRDIKPG